MKSYDHVIGTGGIGSGILFLLKGDHTMGRNESRPGRLEPHRDYCKLHIVLHYLSVLMGAGSRGGFRSWPIGGVGSDDEGKQLLAQMAKAGMDTEHVRIHDDCRTLFSVCFQYPDLSGGNITTENSASNRVSEEDIDDFFRHSERSGGKGIALALPEVPVITRLKLLRHGRDRDCLNVASVLSSEVSEFRAGGGFELADLVSVNIDEARSIARLENESVPAEVIVSRTVEVLCKANSHIRVLVTDGPRGSYGFRDGLIQHHPVIPARARSTAGAGDAFLAGTITGLCRGLPLQTGETVQDRKEAPLRSAIDLGTLLASQSVESPDTIHMGISAGSLKDYALERGLTFSREFESVFQPGR